MYTPLEGVRDQRIISSLFPKPVKTPPLKLIHAAAPLPLLILWSTTCQHLRPFGTRNMHNTLQDRLLILLHSIHCPPRTTRCAVPRTFWDSIAWRIHAVYVISIITAITQDRPFIILGLEAASAQARWAVPAWSVLLLLTCNLALFQAQDMIELVSAVRMAAYQEFLVFIFTCATMLAQLW